MPHRDFISWASILTAYNHVDLPHKTLLMFLKMWELDKLQPHLFVKPNSALEFYLVYFIYWTTESYGSHRLDSTKNHHKNDYHPLNDETLSTNASNSDTLAHFVPWHVMSSTRNCSIFSQFFGAYMVMGWSSDCRLSVSTLWQGLILGTYMNDHPSLPIKATI